MNAQNTTASNDADLIAITKIIRAFWDKGDLSVPCWASNDTKFPTAGDSWVFISGIGVRDFPFKDAEGMCWRYVTPLNHTTFQPITELPHMNHSCKAMAEPSAKPTSHEIIVAMLERVGKSAYHWVDDTDDVDFDERNVHCWVSDTVEEPSAKDKAVEIHYIEDGEVRYYIDTYGQAWFYATPFDPNTNKAITELPK